MDNLPSLSSAGLSLPVHTPSWNATSVQLGATNFHQPNPTYQPQPIQDLSSNFSDLIQSRPSVRDIHGLTDRDPANSPPKLQNTSENSPRLSLPNSEPGTNRNGIDIAETYSSTHSHDVTEPEDEFVIGIQNEHGENPATLQHEVLPVLGEEQYEPIYRVQNDFNGAAFTNLRHEVLEPEYELFVPLPPVRVFLEPRNRRRRTESAFTEYKRLSFSGPKRNITPKFQTRDPQKNIKLKSKAVIGEKLEQNEGLFKETTSEKIPVSGGQITIADCFITFPCGALDKKEDVMITVSSNHKNLPSKYFPVTNVLECRSNLKLLKKIDVRMVTPFRFPKKKKTVGHIMYKDGKKWNFMGKVALTESQYVEFSIRHLSCFVVVVDGDCIDDTAFYTDVYIRPSDQYIVSVLAMYQSHLNRTDKNYVTMGWERLMDTENFWARKRQILNFIFNVCDPRGVNYIPELNYGDEVEVNSELVNILRNGSRKRFFKPQPAGKMQEFNGTLQMQHCVRVDGYDAVDVPLSKKWPPEKENPTTNIGTIVAGSYTSNSRTNSNHSGSKIEVMVNSIPDNDNTTTSNSLWGAIFKHFFLALIIAAFLNFFFHLMTGPLI